MSLERPHAYKNSHVSAWAITFILKVVTKSVTSKLDYDINNEKIMKNVVALHGT